MEALSLLTEEDLSDTHIPQRQRKLLLHAVRSIFPDGAAVRKQSAATSSIDCKKPTAEDTGQPLDTGNSRDQGKCGSYSNQRILLWLHRICQVCIHGKTRKYLKSLDSLNLGANNYLDITDFVNQSYAEERD